MSRGQGLHPSWRLALSVAGPLLCLPGALAGHSFWPTHYSARSAIGIDADGLQAVVVIEVPTSELVADFRRHFEDLDLVAEIEAGRFEELEDRYRESQFARFAADLEIFVDDRPAKGSWRPVKTPVNGRGTEGFFVYMLEFVMNEAVPQRDQLRVRVINRILPEAKMVLANQAQAGDGWVVVESSIPAAPRAELPRGAQMLSELDLWSEEPVKRDLRVTFTHVGAGGR